MTDEQKAKFEALDDRMKGLVDDIECMREELYEILNPADDINEMVHATIPKSYRGLDGPPFID